MDDIAVTKYLETTLTKFLENDNDVSVTKFLNQRSNDTTVTKFLAGDNDISVTKFLNNDNGDISVTKFLDQR